MTCTGTPKTRCTMEPCVKRSEVPPPRSTSTCHRRTHRHTATTTPRTQPEGPGSEDCRDEESDRLQDLGRWESYSFGLSEGNTVLGDRRVGPSLVPPTDVPASTPPRPPSLRETRPDQTRPTTSRLPVRGRVRWSRRRGLGRDGGVHFRYTRVDRTGALTPTRDGPPSPVSLSDRNSPPLPSPVSPSWKTECSTRVGTPYTTRTPKGEREVPGSPNYLLPSLPSVTPRGRRRHQERCLLYGSWTPGPMEGTTGTSKGPPEVAHLSPTGTSPAPLPRESWRE